MFQTKDTTLISLAAIQLIIVTIVLVIELDHPFKERYLIQKQLVHSENSPTPAQTNENNESIIFLQSKNDPAGGKGHGDETPIIWTAVGFQQRLGNQLFQVASAYGIAKSRGSRLCVKNLPSYLNEDRLVFV